MNRVITVLAAFSIAMAIAYSTSFLPSEAEPNLYAGIPLDRHLLELDKRALNEAYHAQIIKLFQVWLTDGAHHPGPITKGLQNARRAYNLATQQIAVREKELEQKP